MKLLITRFFVWYGMFYCIGWTFVGMFSSPEERFQIQPQIKSVNTLIQWVTGFCLLSANQWILTEPKSSLKFQLIEALLWHLIEPIRPQKIFMNPKPDEDTLPKVLKITAMISRRRTPAMILSIVNISQHQKLKLKISSYFHKPVKYQRYAFYRQRLICLISQGYQIHMFTKQDLAV